MSSSQSKSDAPANANLSASPACNGNRNNTEQPQTKRQKIEKIKSNGKNSALAIKTTTITTNKTPPPDIIDTGETADPINSKHLCSSLSSSVHSISTPSSSNNSPTSTPSSSRTTSFSHLLNVQNIVNILPSTVDTATSKIPSERSESSTNSFSDQSSDEVDRVALSDLLSTPTPTATNSKQKAPQNFAADESSAAQDMRAFEESLIKQCLCGVSERTLQKPFQSHYSVDPNGQKRIANLSEWPTNKLMQFLSNLQLLFDIYLKQNSKGFICARIMDVCDALIRNDHNLIDEIIVLAGYSNAFVQFLAGRVLASFLVIAKQEMNDDWLKKLVDNLFNFDRLDHIAVQKIHFSLEIIKRIVDWKDVDLHPLEDEIADTRGNAGISNTTSTSMTGNSVAILDNGLGAHSYMHFQTQHPTLENNYFAVHFRTTDAIPNTNEHQLQSDAQQVGDSEIRRERRIFNTSQMQSNAANTTNANADLPYVANDLTLHGRDTEENFHNENPVISVYHATSTNGICNSNYNEIGDGFLTPAASLLDGCHIVTLTDSESFDTNNLKCVTIKTLENKWPALVKNMSALIANHLDIANAENCILNFLQLWENIISVKANLSIVETLPFYAQLDKFELLLNQNLSCTIYKQMLCLFNEALCYGSTLALQDMLPEETCSLAHQIVRHVKDFRILESLPRRQPENIVSFIGFKRHAVIYNERSLQLHYALPTTESLADGDIIEMDKTILQKMVLLVLKSIAVTVKEIRSDSSDSSIDSTDYDAFQDMVLIERSIRDVLRKLESFIKHTLEFHPECHFSKILIHLFDDQDDHLIEAMVCTLDVTAGISFRNNAFPELVSMLNPVYTFLEFLKMISNSSDLLLDLLVSNETCFLLYLLRFLKYIRMNWSMFVQSCHDFGMGTSMLDEAMSVLIRLRLQISRLVSRQLYPYDISPVLRLLESCESLYEGNELS